MTDDKKDALVKAARTFTPDQIELVKRTIAKGATNDELKLFLYQCERTGLDPFVRQIYMVKRRSRDRDGNWVEVAQTQTAIDGFRVIAERTGEYDGQDSALWCGEDGQWVDVWLKSTPPLAAKVSIYRKGRSKPFVGIAKWTEYVQTRQDGTPTGMWARMHANQLAKCAEALAFRKAFPQDLSGLYTPEEMDQADVDAEGKPTLVEVLKSALDDLTDEDRARVKSAFTHLQLNAAQETVLVNEFFGTVTDPKQRSEAVEKLLAKCREDFKKKPKAEGNNKPLKQAAGTTLPEARVDPNAAGSDVRSAGTEVPGRPASNPAPSASSELF